VISGLAPVILHQDARTPKAKPGFAPFRGVPGTQTTASPFNRGRPLTAFGARAPFSNVRGIRGSRGGDVPVECRRRDAEAVRDLGHADVGIGEHCLGGLDVVVREFRRAASRAAKPLISTLVSSTRQEPPARRAKRFPRFSNSGTERPVPRAR
jgi:hypothetical protein